MIITSVLPLPGAAAPCSPPVVADGAAGAQAEASRVPSVRRRKSAPCPFTCPLLDPYSPSAIISPEMQGVHAPCSCLAVTRGICSGLIDLRSARSDDGRLRGMEERAREGIREAEAYKSPYEEWKESQGLSTIRGIHVPNLMDVPLAPWAARWAS